MDICCFSDGFLSFFTYVILTNVSNGANFCMKLPYFMKEISIFAPKPCILRNLRSKRERSGFSLLNLTALLRNVSFIINGCHCILIILFQLVLKVMQYVMV